MTTKTCYGTMLPDFERLRFNREAPGEVFSVSVQSCGIGVQHKQIDFHAEQWEQCQRCESYQSCRDFSMLKLGVHLAMRQMG